MSGPIPEEGDMAGPSFPMATFNSSNRAQTFMSSSSDSQHSFRSMRVKTTVELTGVCPKCNKRNGKYLATLHLSARNNVINAIRCQSCNHDLARIEGPSSRFLPSSRRSSSRPAHSNMTNHRPSIRSGLASSASVGSSVGNPEYPRAALSAQVSNELVRSPARSQSPKENLARLQGLRGGSTLDDVENGSSYIKPKRTKQVRKRVKKFLSNFQRLTSKWHQDSAAHHPNQDPVPPVILTPNEATEASPGLSPPSEPIGSSSPQLPPIPPHDEIIQIRDSPKQSPAAGPIEARCQYCNRKSCNCSVVYMHPDPKRTVENLGPFEQRVSEPSSSATDDPESYRPRSSHRNDVLGAGHWQLSVPSRNHRHSALSFSSQAPTDVSEELQSPPPCPTPPVAAAILSDSPSAIPLPPPQIQTHEIPAFTGLPTPMTPRRSNDQEHPNDEGHPVHQQHVIDPEHPNDVQYQNNGL